MFRLCSVVVAVALAAGAHAQPQFDDITEPALVSSRAHLSGAVGVSLNDYDNDGLPDILATEAFGPNVMLLHNEGDGRFADRLAALQISLTGKTKGGGKIFGDYDNDGDLDLYFPDGRFGLAGNAPNLLLRNDRGVFVEAALLDDQPTDNAVWTDVDGDGFLDLYSGNLGFAGAPYNTLYRSLGDGTFEEIGEESGVHVTSESLSGLHGGTNGGISSADLDGDGWPDLYLGVYNSENLVFLNNGDGTFRDASSGPVADPGPAFGIAIGDIDNDGWMDLFIGNGGSSGAENRSKLLLNLGGGEFIDVTASAGIDSLLSADVLGVDLVDIDNDGDLDLLSANPALLYLNEGDGTFHETDGPLPDDGVLSVALGDVNLDGFLDIAAGGWTALGLYRNRGNANHWLRIDLVGTASNRDGIGARVVARAGQLAQTRQLLGGTGYAQDELVVHFGLGDHDLVDRLEIHWPSGQIDVLEGVPVDRVIRVIEGHAGYHVVEPNRWVRNDLPAEAPAFTSREVNLAVRPALFDAGARITAVHADLSAFGGPDRVPLDSQGDGTYTLRRSISLGANGRRVLPVFIDQSTAVGPRWVRMERTIQVLPAGDAQITGVSQEGAWSATRPDGGPLPPVELTEGAPSVSFNGPFQAVYRPPVPLERFGYQSLRFSVHPGTSHRVPRTSPIPVDIAKITGSEGINILLWAMPSDGSRLDTLSLEEMRYGQGWSPPAWSPDGRRIAVPAERFRTSGFHQTDIYILNADGTQQTNVTDHPGINISPAWSPDGRRLVFASDRVEPTPQEAGTQITLRGRRFKLFVMDLESGDLRQLTDGPGYDVHPSWSPDGRRIVFESDRDAQDDFTSDIYVIDADGSNLVRLTNTPGWDDSPSWSPDGARIAFGSLRSGNADIWTMAPDGSDPRQVTRHTGYDGAPAWSPDGRWITFYTLRASGNKIFATDPAGSIPPFFVTWGSYHSWSPLATTPPAHLVVAVNGITHRLVVPDLEGIGVDLQQRAWQQIEIPLPQFGNEPIEEVRFIGELAGTIHLGDVRITGPAQRPPTAVEETQDVLPQRVELAQNYPNPFNASTVIRFALPRAQPVRLDIYSVLGQRLAGLVSGVQAAGVHQVSWNGRDATGHPVASGLYLYSLRTADGVETRKLLYLR